jgi:integrase
MTPRPGRKRSSNKFPAHIDRDKLPVGVEYKDKGRGFFRVSYIDESTGKRRYRRLCDSKATLSQIWQSYEIIIPKQIISFRSLSNDFMQTPRWRELNKLTKNDYEFCHNKICETNAGSWLFGDIPISSWKISHVLKYRDFRGEESKSRANKELAYIKLVLAWAKLYEKIPVNIAHGVPKLKTPPRQHYAEEKDYNFLLDVARESNYWYLAPILELAYECRMRSIEVLNMTDANELPEGLLIKRNKGSRDNITLWSDNLRKIWEYAKTQRNKILADKKLVRQFDPEKRYIFISERGGGLITSRALKTAKNRVDQIAIEKAKALGMNFVPFTIHDVKRRGISDTTGDKMAASGHRSQSMMNIYDVSTAKVKPTSEK